MNVSEPGGIRTRSFGKTDVGKKRENNQDSILLSPDNKFFILADGMGGHQGGEEASRLATKTVAGVFSSPGSAPMLNTADEMSLNNLVNKAKRLTRAAILAADQEIVNSGKENPELHGMGATIETILLEDQMVVIGHVGDSRIYRMRGGSLEQITSDHSVLAEEMKRRKMTEKEIEDFPFKNRITRALGHLDDRVVDIHREKIEKGDMFLMCSDGLTDVASDKEIERILNDSKGNPQTACDVLVQTALDGGGPDNISVIVVEFD